jgi:hypothetical protein
VSVTNVTVGPPAGEERARYMEIVIFSIVMLAGVIYGYFTVGGSGIAETPYGKIYGGAPGALGPASASGRDERVSISDWTRGTR